MQLELSTRKRDVRQDVTVLVFNERGQELRVALADGQLVGVEVVVFVDDLLGRCAAGRLKCSFAWKNQSLTHKFLGAIK